MLRDLFTSWIASIQNDKILVADTSARFYHGRP